MLETQIRELLDRYWEGETTVEEERRLREFFAREPVPESLRQEARLFRALQTEQTVKMPPGRLSVAAPLQRFASFGWIAAAAVALLVTAGIWWWRIGPDVASEAPVVQAHAPLVPEPATARPDTTPARIPDPVYAQLRPRGIKRAPQKAPQDTFDDPEKALAEIKAVLALVSSKINKGKKEIGKGLQEVDNVDILLKKKKEDNG